MQFQADILGVTVSKPQNHETTAKGAAMLAGLHSGFWTMGAFKDESEKAEVYSSKMKPEKREKIYKQWLKAVERSKNWID